MNQTEQKLVDFIAETFGLEKERIATTALRMLAYELANSEELLESLQLTIGTDETLEGLIVVAGDYSQGTPTEESGNTVNAGDYAFVNEERQVAAGDYVDSGDYSVNDQSR